MMLSPILLVACCIAFVASAPTASEKQQQQQQQKILPADTSQLQRRPVLLFGPQSQIEIQPAFRLQQSLVQSLAPLGRIQGPNEQTMLLFYPNAPLSPLTADSSNSPLLKQDNPAQIFFDQFWGFIQNLPGQGAGGGDGMNDPTTGGGNSPITIPSFGTITQLIPGSQFKPQSSANLEFEPDAEEIPKQPQPQLPQTPASTYPLPNYPNNFIYYTIGGSPQFFGNFDYLKSSQNAQLPFFRWPENDFNKEQRVLDPIKEISQNEETKIQPVSPAEPLRLTKLPENNVENKPGEAAKRFSEFLLKQRIYQPQPILIRPEYFDKSLSEIKGEQKQQFKVLEEGSLKEGYPSQQSKMTEDQSVAQARPVAVSVAGKGGLARSVPVSTAIVGNKGVALSSPSATSVSGEFQEEQPSKTGIKSNNNN